LSLKTPFDIFPIMIETRERDGKKILSAGYPDVENLVDSEDFDAVNLAFETAYEELEAINKKKRGLKKGRDAKKAMLAIEHVMDLFKELLEIKYSLLEVLDNASKSKKKK